MKKTLKKKFGVIKKEKLVPFILNKKKRGKIFPAKK
jgi:hypothetical protein